MGDVVKVVLVGIVPAFVIGVGMLVESGGGTVLLVSILAIPLVLLTGAAVLARSTAAQRGDRVDPRPAVVLLRGFVHDAYRRFSPAAMTRDFFQVPIALVLSTGIPSFLIWEAARARISKAQMMAKTEFMLATSDSGGAMMDAIARAQALAHEHRAVETNVAPLVLLLLGSLYLLSFFVFSLVSMSRQLNTAELLGPHVRRRLGPYRALAGPHTRVGGPGPSAVPVADATWRESVSQMLGGARCAVVLPGESAGLRWELSHLRECCDLRRVFVVYPWGDAYRQDEAEGLVRILEEARIDVPVPEPGAVVALASARGSGAETVGRADGPEPLVAMIEASLERLGPGVVGGTTASTPVSPETSTSMELIAGIPLWRRVVSRAYDDVEGLMSVVFGVVLTVSVGSVGLMASEGSMPWGALPRLVAFVAVAHVAIYAVYMTIKTLRLPHGVPEPSLNLWPVLAVVLLVIGIEELGMGLSGLLAEFLPYALYLPLGLVLLLFGVACARRTRRAARFVWPYFGLRAGLVFMGGIAIGGSALFFGGLGAIFWLVVGMLVRSRLTIDA